MCDAGELRGIYMAGKEICAGTRTRRVLLRTGILALLFLLILMPLEASAAGRISEKSKTILKGQSFILRVTGTKAKVKWSSSKKSVASVNASGVVKGKKLGTAVITAKVNDKSYRCTVTVRQPVNKIKLSKTSVTLQKGRTITLKAAVKPNKAYNKAVVWASSNKSVASVTQKGKVTAKGTGNALITVKARDGSGVVGACVVMVEGPENVLTLSDESLDLYQGEFRVLSVSGGAASKIVWGSSNYAVATVGLDGTVVAVAPGTAQIVAMTQDGLSYASCTVKVLESETSPSASAVKFLDILAKYSEYVRAGRANGHYMAYSNSGDLNKNTWKETVETMDSRGIAYTNCAHMVRLALREMGKLGESQNFWGDNGKIHFNAGVEETLKQSCRIFYVGKSADQLFNENGLLPGDICIWSGMVHTNVYAGNKLWYDAGRGTDGGTGAGGSYMTPAQLKAGGVPEAVMNEDIKNDNDNPKLKSSVYVFNSLGPHGINLGSAEVAWIIRLVK